MGQGTVVHNQIFRYNDPDTGREVLRLTSPECLSTHPYFYFNCISRDNRFVVFGSDLSGSRRLHKVDVETGDITQLTQREKMVVYQACLSLDDQTLVYATASQVVRLDLETLEEEVVYTLGPEWWANKTFGVTPDCTYVAQVQMHRDDLIPRDRYQGNMAEQWRVKPRCRLVIIDLLNKSSQVVFDQKLWVAHPQVRPIYKDKLMFCHEGPGNLIDSRIWLMDMDGSNILCPRPHKQRESFTHEYWYADGSALGYVANLRDENNKTVETSIRKISMDTMEETVVMPCSFYSHCVSNRDNTMIVGDGRDPQRPYIFISDLRSGKEIPVCRHDSNWGIYHDPGIGENINQDAHPHPQFSQDGTKIVFNSDKEGKPCVYMTDISDLI